MNDKADLRYLDIWPVRQLQICIDISIKRFLVLLYNHFMNETYKASKIEQDVIRATISELLTNFSQSSLETASFRVLMVLEREMV